MFFNIYLKLNKVWHINFKEIQHLITRVFEIDRILYEQQLARKWLPPNFDLDKYDYIKVTSKKQKTSKYQSKPQEIVKTNLPKTANQKQLHDILHKISDRAGFLVEERLLDILKPYTDDEKCLVRIESIFSVS